MVGTLDLDLEVLGLNPTRSRVQLMTVWCLSLSSLFHLDILNPLKTGDL